MSDADEMIDLLLCLLLIFVFAVWGFADACLLAWRYHLFWPQAVGEKLLSRVWRLLSLETKVTQFYSTYLRHGKPLIIPHKSVFTAALHFSAEEEKYRQSDSTETRPFSSCLLPSEAEVHSCIQQAANPQEMAAWLPPLPEALSPADDMAAAVAAAIRLQITDRLSRKSLRLVSEEWENQKIGVILI